MIRQGRDVARDDSRTKQLAHDRLTERFDELMDDYDLGRRTDMLVGRFLGGIDLRDRLVLDAGCGVGGLTRALVATGARVVAVDIGPQLAATTRRRHACSAAVGSLTALCFPIQHLRRGRIERSDRAHARPEGLRPRALSSPEAGRPPRALDSESSVARAGPSGVGARPSSVRRLRELSVALGASQGAGASRRSGEGAPRDSPLAVPDSPASSRFAMGRRFRRGAPAADGQPVHLVHEARSRITSAACVFWP